VVYASRRRVAEWRAGLYDSYSEVVRIDLETGAETVVATKNTGLITAADILIDGDVERVLLLRTLGFPGAGRGSGSEFGATTFERSGGAVGPTRWFSDVGGSGYDIRVPGHGYIRQAEFRGSLAGRGWAAFTSADLVAGRFARFGSLREAAVYLIGCPPEQCEQPVSANLLLLVEALEKNPTVPARRGPMGSSPERFIARFGDRDSAFFPDPSDPTGSYVLGYDLAGGAVAAPSGPLANLSAAPVMVFKGKAPFLPTASFNLDVKTFADDQL